MSPNEAIHYANHVHELLNQIEGLAKPVIAAINGFALMRWMPNRTSL